MQKQIHIKLITLVSVLLVAALIGSIAVYGTYEYSGEFTNKEGGFLGIGAKTYLYKVYRDSVGAYVMYHSKDACYPLYHTYGSGTVELSYTRTVSVLSQTAYEFSTSLGLEVGIEALVNLAANVSSGLTYTSGLEISASGTVGTTLPASSPTGYYKLTPCQNFHQRRLDKYLSGSTSLISSEYCYIPEGSTYIATLYSTDNVSYSIY